MFHFQNKFCTRFPTLGSASNGTSKAAGVWGGKAGGDEEADAEGDEEVEA